MTCPHCGPLSSMSWVPPGWSNSTLTVYHGTIAKYASDILAHGVNISKCSPFTDFGRGFYTTTSQDQAKTWAREASIRLRWTFPNHSDHEPTVLMIVIARHSIMTAACLGFVRGDFNADEYWSFIWHCRSRSRNIHKVFQLCNRKIAAYFIHFISQHF